MGKPKANKIGFEVVKTYHDYGFKWRKIAQLIGVHEETLRKWRKEIRFDEITQPSSIRTPTDNELQKAVAEYTTEHINRGERSVAGHLLGNCGFKVTRSRMRDAIRLVDGEGRELRKAKRITRRGL